MKIFKRVINKGRISQREFTIVLFFYNSTTVVFTPKGGDLDSLYMSGKRGKK